ncbi:MAG: acyltransferase [Coriobacteriales bacterium]|nr:acyltransferase [Coriobacteriales bacterium]
MSDPVTSEHPRHMRIDEFDVLRVLAALAVVYIHMTSKAAPGLPHQSAYFIVNRVAAFAVPAFIAIAAGLAWGPRPGRRHGHGSLSYITRRLRALVPPYAFWTVIYVVVGWLAVAPASLLAGAAEMVRALLTGTGWYHLYFVPIVIVVYLASPIARRIGQASPATLLGLSFAFGLAAAAFIRPWPDAGTSADTFARGAIYVPYAGLGAWYVHRREVLMPHLRRWWPLLLVFGVGMRVWLAGWAQFGNPYDDAALTLVVSLELAGLTGLCLAFADRWCAATMRLGHSVVPLTYGVFLIHPLVLLGVFALLDRFAVAGLWGSTAFTLVAYVPAVALCFGSVWLLRTSPLGKRVT